MHVALVTTFYPNRAEPLRAVFVRNLAIALEAHAKITVVSPVPYAPPFPKRPRWIALRAIPERVSDGSRTVFHPRFVAVPKLTALNGATYGSAVAPVLRQLVSEEGVDVIHAHCAFPDAVGVALASETIDAPFVMTAHGSDINVYSEAGLIRPQLAMALKRASGIIAVSRAMREKIHNMVPGIEDRLSHIPCAGIDKRVFAPRNRDEARRQLQLAPQGRIALFVGQLVPIKAVGVLLNAWRSLLDAGLVQACDRLVIIGDGPLRRELQQASRDAAFQGTVQFPGEVPQEQVALWLSAANVFCLPSRNEGTPNVIVEALASGRPVVASRVGGIPELISDGLNGFLAAPEDVTGLANALGLAFERSWNAADIAAGVADYTWESLARRNMAVLESAVERGAQVDNAYIK
jgi:teichuronic acid biosynthesis glycosyltransferase TuaC